MKPLNQYPTPETDKSKFQLPDKQFAITASKARSMERRLTVCRDMLREIADTPATRTNVGWMIPDDVRNRAEKALKATEPK